MHSLSFPFDIKIITIFKSIFNIEPHCFLIQYRKRLFLHYLKFFITFGFVIKYHL